jgi:hypothetical protein
LAADFPSRPDFRLRLAKSHMNLALLLQAGGRPEKAAAANREALALFKELATDFPTVPDYQAGLANTLLSLAEQAQARHDDVEAFRLLGEALPAGRAALHSNPGHPFYRVVATENLKRLMHAGLGLGEHAAVAAAAEALLPIGLNPPYDAYNAACHLARCVPLAGKDGNLSDPRRQELARGYADRAVALLRRAVAAGFQDAAHMKRDTDLDSLRGRDDFQKLLADLEARTPAPPK